MLNETPGRIERSKRDKLERIKRAARKLFGRKGFEATTTREIAAAADIGAGTLFLYAGTKEDLLVLLFREDMSRVVSDAFATMPSRALLDQVLHLFGAMIALHEKDRGLARVFVRELPFVEDRRHGVAEMVATHARGDCRPYRAGEVARRTSCGYSCKTSRAQPVRALLLPVAAMAGQRSCNQPETR